MQAAFGRCRNQLDGALCINNVDFIIINVRTQCTGQFRAFGFLYRDVVFDIHGVQHLATKTLAHQAGTNTFTRRVNRRRCTRRATADNQHFIGFTLVQRFRRTLVGVGVDLADDFSQAQAALTKLFAVQEHGWHAHDIAFLNLILEHAAIDRRVRDTRVDHRHQVQRLHHVRAVMAGERIIGFEVEIAFQRGNLIQQLLRFFRRMPTGLQQCQNQ